MEKKSIFSEIENLLARKGWWKGEVRIPYNFMWLLIILGILLLPLLVAILLLAAILYGIWWLAVHAWPYLKAFGAWLLALLIAFWAWLCGLFHREPREKKPEEKKEKRNWWWLLAAILLLLLLLFCFKRCDGKEDTVEPETIEYVTPMETWSDVVVYRVHLDALMNNSRLIGLKNRGLKRATEAEYHGNALAESEEVVENEWTTLVNEQVHVDLNRHQMAATILYAMRCGRYGFPQSDFLKSLNAGDFAQAEKDLMKLHDQHGRVLKNGEEATKYLYELRLIFTGQLSVEEVLKCHWKSYLTYPDGKEYYPEALKKVILTGAPYNKTVQRIIDEAQ